MSFAVEGGEEPERGSGDITDCSTCAFACSRSLILCSNGAIRPYPQAAFRDRVLGILRGVVSFRIPANTPMADLAFAEGLPGNSFKSVADRSANALTEGLRESKFRKLIKSLSKS